ncbi:MAG TPA: trypsin-like serine protease [Myxococcota bacterium]|nr:trypsin-like serine protease [Myxococcota bacterium]
MILSLICSLGLADDTGLTAPPPVVGGGAAPAGKWPDTAAIVFNGNSVGCTGTLIAPDVVITAGHCVGGITHVILDSTNYYNNGEKIRVRSSHEYSNSWGTVDVAVLVLEEETTIEPRVIAQDCILDTYLADGADVQIVGYGATDIWGTVYTSTLMEATSTVADHDCTDMWRGCNYAVSPGGEIAAGGEGVDACYGDSGGPLYLLTPEGHYLVGVTSRSYANVYAPCEEGGIWGRPDYVVDWIEEKTGRSMPAPDCDGDDDPGPDDDDDDGGGSDDNRAPEPVWGNIVVVAGSMARTRVVPNDPDSEDAHSYALIEASELGEAFVEDDGTVIVRPASSGEEVLRVKVTDDGDPPQSTVAEVTVEVIEPTAEGGGCGAVPLGGAWLLGLLVLWRRQRRSSPP